MIKPETPAYTYVGSLIAEAANRCDQPPPTEVTWLTATMWEEIANTALGSVREWVLQTMTIECREREDRPTVYQRDLKVAFLKAQLALAELELAAAIRMMSQKCSDYWHTGAQSKPCPACGMEPWAPVNQL